MSSGLAVLQPELDHVLFDLNSPSIRDAAAEQSTQSRRAQALRSSAAEPWDVLATKQRGIQAGCFAVEDF